jgi:6-pyruvoyltetrahydropterin/6-carboxytetrahydropterin synthase
MFEVQVEVPFSAAHHLEGYAGRCSRVHGHRWKVRAIVRGRDTSPWGMLVDVRRLRALLQSILERFEGCDLNLDPLFRGSNPSAENLATEIYRLLYRAPLVGRSAPGAWLQAVEVEETPGSAARYCRADAHQDG